MKLRVGLVLIMSMIFALGLAGVASAQTPCDTLTFTNGSALPGGSETVCGTGPANVNVVLTFDDITEVGNTNSDENGQFCIPFTVPTDAAAGYHVITFLFSLEVTNCSSFYEVEAAVPSPAAEVPVPVAAPAAEVPVAATLPATLPSTGFMLIPAGGLLAVGLGTLLIRKRRR